MAAAGSMTPYHDLCAEIDILEIRIRDLEMEYKFWYRTCHGGSLPLDTCLIRMKEICDQVEMYSTMLEKKEEARKEIEGRLNQFEGLEQKVAYMRDIKGMTLPEIAAHLGYSYDWIKKLSARTRKKGTKKALSS